jgi:hypothetical protein
MALISCDGFFGLGTKSFDGMFDVVRAPAERARTQSFDSFVHFSHNLGPTGSLRRREVEHLEALGFKADLGEEFFGAFDTAARAEVTLLEMASAFEATGDEDAVNTSLERREQIVHFNFARAGQAQYADGIGILDPHGPGEVRRRVGAVVATKR